MLYVFDSYGTFIGRFKAARAVKIAAQVGGTTSKRRHASGII